MLWITSSRARKSKAASQKTAMLSWRALLFNAALAMVSPNMYAASFVDDMTNSDEQANSLNRSLSG